MSTLDEHPPERDPYADGTAERYWHLSTPSPEIRAALQDGWLRPGMRVLDLGCGLASEIAYLATLGFQVTGVDISAEAIRRATAAHPGLELIKADVRHLPFAAEAFDVLLDRGCFHYLAVEDRAAYAAEAWRILRPDGRLLLRACLRAQGVRNDLDAHTIRSVFREWEVRNLTTTAIPSDARTMEAVVARLVRRAGSGVGRSQRSG
jgi:SAM-dependent methyltransferase